MEPLEQPKHAEAAEWGVVAGAAGGLVRAKRKPVELKDAAHVPQGSCNVESADMQAEGSGRLLVLLAAARANSSPVVSRALRSGSLLPGCLPALMSSSDTTAALDTAIPLLAWYAFNGAFNVENKRVLNELSYPWFISWVQLAAGIGIAVPAWLLGLRRPPLLTAAVLLRFLPIAVLHAAGKRTTIARAATAPNASKPWALSQDGMHGIPNGVRLVHDHKYRQDKRLVAALRCARALLWSNTQRLRKH